MLSVLHTYSKYRYVHLLCVALVVNSKTMYIHTDKLMCNGSLKLKGSGVVSNLTMPGPEQSVN